MGTIGLKWANDPSAGRIRDRQVVWAVRKTSWPQLRGCAVPAGRKIHVVGDGRYSTETLLRHGADQVAEAVTFCSAKTSLATANFFAYAESYYNRERLHSALGY